MKVRFQIFHSIERFDISVTSIIHFNRNFQHIHKVSSKNNYSPQSFVTTLLSSFEIFLFHCTRSTRRIYFSTWNDFSKWNHDLGLSKTSANIILKKVAGTWYSFYIRAITVALWIRTRKTLIASEMNFSKKMRVRVWMIVIVGRSISKRK